MVDQVEYQAKLLPSVSSLYMNIRVALPLPRLEPLTYRCEGASVQRGCRVLVPLGTRVLTGMVVEIDVPDVPNLRDICEVLDDRPSCTDHVLLLTRRVAEYYMCSWGEALQAAMPSGFRATSIVRVIMLKHPDASDLEQLAMRAPRRAELLRVISTHQGELTVSYLQRKLKSTTIADQLDALQRDGWVDIQQDVTAVATARTQKAVGIHPDLLSDEKALRSAFDTLDARAPKQSLAMGHVYLEQQRTGAAVAVQHCTTALSISSSTITALVERGYLVATTVAYRRHDEGSIGSLSERDEREVVLTTEQSACLETITTSINNDAFHPIVLHGVTGSGKTIVYQRAIAHVLERKQRALLLVPEIALTPQLADRFRTVFGDAVAVLHSRLAAGERVTLWKRIQDGDVPIVIGARSAVFAPIDNVGLIIVDEEHEPSYKQDDPAPRYHGRDVAILRAQLSRCSVVLGSATPSLESLAMIQSGRASLCTLTHRADHAVLPHVHVVDMRQERKAQRVDGALSHKVLDAIAERVQRAEGTLVFLNRRGYAASMQCDDCGDVPMCMNCDVALTYHKHASQLKCHYCGYAEPARNVCFVCGSVELRESGTGTQQLEEHVRTAVEQRISRAPRVDRLDADRTSRKGEHRSILERFQRGDIDVLIGTQMIAKGLDIARVSLVVVVDADQMLHRPDFRATERTVQMLTQLAGRAGRSAAAHGEMYIQTSSPDHPAIEAAVQGERSPEALRAWEQSELSLRREAMYPPFWRFVRLEVSSLDEPRAAEHAQILAALIPPTSPVHQRLDPVTPPIARIRNMYRNVIIIKNRKEADPAGTELRSILRGALDVYYREYASSHVQVTVDIDAHGTF